MLAQRLRDLDNRVLGMDKRMANLRTEEGWRRNAARWWVFAALSAAGLLVSYVSGFLHQSSFSGLVLFGGLMAFHAGSLKAEDDRLHRRGAYRYLPPGL